MKEIEAVVARANELADGEMKEVVVGETKVLLARVKGKFHALSAACPHYGGPLPEGALCGERVVCPWHQAAFRVVTGALEEPPALDGLAPYQVRVEGDQVIVRLPKAPETRTMPMARHDPKADGRTFAILGAGAAGNAAAETLRQDAFQGRLLLITQELRLPYDRPSLSKGYLSGVAPPESLPWRTPEFYRDHDIEVLLGRPVTRVEAAARSLEFADGSRLTWDALLLAPGGVPRRLEVPGMELANIFTLRSADDADRIMAAATQASRAVVVGGSFIGMEVAASLGKRGLAVTVVGRAPVPFAATLGAEIGAMVRQLYEENGVAFRLGTQVSRFRGQGRVEAAILASGERLAADLVVVGVGVKPATDFLQAVPLNPDGSVTVDPHFQVAPGLFAAGDIARFPDWRTGELIRIEHWRLAEQHGRVAAHNMAGNRVAFTGIPFFWTELFDLFLQYVGHATHWEEIIWHGEVAARKFLAFYVKEGRVLAAAGLEHDRDLAQIAELMRLNRMPSPAELRRGPLDFAARLRQQG